MVSLREGISMCLNEWPNNNPDGFAGAREKGLGLLMKSAGKNSFYSFCGQNCKNPFLYFFCGPAEKEIPCGRAGQLPAAGAAGNGYASERCSIPRRSAKPGAARDLAGRAQEVRFPAVFAASSAAARSADACGFSRIGCSIPRCTRSASVAGGGRPADAAQEVLFPVPASLASNNSAGASERSACQPRQRLAKGDAASIRRSIPLNQEDVMRPGGYPGDPKFHVVGYASVANGVETIADGRKNKKWTKIHRTIPCGGVWDYNLVGDVCIKKNMKIIAVLRRIGNCIANDCGSALPFLYRGRKRIGIFFDKNRSGIETVGKIGGLNPNRKINRRGISATVCGIFKRELNCALVPGFGKILCADFYVK